MSWLLVGIVFAIGAAIGSFANVLVDRSVAGKNWVGGRSICDWCGKQLTWYDNIPLLSFLAYWGKSRCCHKKLAWKHPVVEAMFGALFVWWLLIGLITFQLASAPWTVIQPGFWLLTGILLGIVAIADWRYGVILMPVVYLGTAATYLYRIGVYQVRDLGLMLLVGLLSAGFLWLLRVMTKGKGMGEGDPYLAFWTGSLLAWPRAFWGMLLAFVLGAIWGVVLLLLKYRKLNQTIAFGPFLVLGAILTMLLTHYGYL